MTVRTPDNEAIFHAARDIPDPDRRREYVREACDGDEMRIAHVAALLSAADAPDSLLDRRAVSGPVATLDQPAAENAGTMIGPYKLLQQIGEGGMGTVYMAEQTAPVQRKVALKIIKAGMDSRQVVARFEAERQALAMMDHVNIARVFDAGATDAGRPYFVMELVHGVPITKYCDDNHLTPRERLELFVPVCQAIQHAHQKGIIHRDIKPNNVMVTLYDGRPVPKVIDFGVAKATEQKLTERTLFTQYGTMVGTLEYMSPEQAEMSALGVDTRSDIYSLGVLLYELLTGNTPLTHKRMKEGVYAEILRMIKEEEPPKPSTRLSESAEALASISANRHTEPAKLTKLMRGELDWIVMKCLEKDRNRRYETANGFAMDVQRYLADETVLACPPSAAYRLRKFARRNKGPVLAASIVLLCLLAGMISTSAGLIWAIRERDNKAKALIAKTTAREAEKQARDQALAALRAMTDDIVENQMARGTTLTQENKEFLRTIIKHYEGFAAITADDAESRIIRQEGYFRVGKMRYRLGEFKEAEAAFLEALALLKQLVPDFPNRAEFRYYLAATHTNLGLLFMNTGRPKEAETADAEAIATATQLAADFPDRPFYRQLLATSHYNLANLLRRTPGRLKEVEAAYAEALALEKKLVADFHYRPDFRSSLIATQDALGSLLSETDRPKEAEATYGDALALRKQLDADFPNVPEFRFALSQSHYNLALLLRATSRPKDAEAAYGEAIAIQKQLAANFHARPDFRRELARSHHSLGDLLRETDRPKDAETAYGNALALLKQLTADFRDRPDYGYALAATHSNLGIVLSSLGKRPEAAAAYRHALDIREKLNAEFPGMSARAIDLGGGYCNYGNLVREGGQPEAALDWYQKAIATLDPLMAIQPRPANAQFFLRNSHAGRATGLDSLGRHAEATRDWERAVELDDGRGAVFVRVNLAASRLRRSQKDKDAAGCLAAAADYEALKVTAAELLYNAACFRAICAGVIPRDPKTPATDAARLAKEQADLAMTWLLKAVAAGFTDAENMKKDADLVTLREREDFKKLVAESQAKKK